MRAWESARQETASKQTAAASDGNRMERLRKDIAPPRWAMLIRSPIRAKWMDKSVKTTESTTPDSPRIGDGRTTVSAVLPPAGVGLGPGRPLSPRDRQQSP